jgi:aerobic carbon-monoxide dehydrogenase medium subunit
MKPAPFQYLTPTTVEEAVSLLAGHDDEAKVLAGGQSLVPMMALRLAAPPVLVDLNRVAGLSGVRLDGSTLTVGAMARHREVEEVPGLRQRCPMVAEAVELVGHVAIRNRGTVGGSLAHADPAAEWAALALALDAQVKVVGPSGPRVISAEEFFITYFTTALAPDEIVREVRFSLPDGWRTGSAFVEMARQHGDFALAGAAGWLTLGGDGTVADARVALIGVKDVAVRSHLAEAALVGRRPTDEAIGEATRAIEQEIQPPNDAHGSAEFRRHVANVMVERALTTARARAERNTAGA